MGVGGDEITKGHEETVGGDRHVHLEGDDVP